MQPPAVVPVQVGGGGELVDVIPGLDELGGRAQRPVVRLNIRLVLEGDIDGGQRSTLTADRSTWVSQEA